MKKEWYFDRFCGEQIVAYAEDGKIIEIRAENEESGDIVGNIYKGRVANVVVGMQAAFVSCGMERNCYLPLDEGASRFSTYDGEGNVRSGELICNVAIAADLLDIFQNLYKAEYPIERIQLIDDYGADDVKSMQANNTSCFNYREIAGTDKLSKHALGLAIDINPLYNPWVKRKNGRLSVSPEEGRPYVDRTREFPYKIDEGDLCYKEFRDHGFTWGGSWKSLKDYQHFEK